MRTPPVIQDIDGDVWRDGESMTPDEADAEALRLQFHARRARAYKRRVLQLIARAGEALARREMGDFKAHDSDVDSRETDVERARR